MATNEEIIKDMIDLVSSFPEIDSNWGKGNNLKLKGQRYIPNSGGIGITTDTDIVYAFHYPKVNKIVVKCEGWVFESIYGKGIIQNTAVLES